MLMFASTNTFVAAPVPPGPALADVDRVSDWPPTVRVTDALIVTVPALGELKVMVHLPLVVPVVAHTLFEMLTAEPFESVGVTTGLVPAGGFEAVPSPLEVFTVTVTVWGLETS